MLRLIKYLVILVILFTLALPVIVFVTGAETTPLVAVPEGQGTAEVRWPAVVLERIDPGALDAGKARVLTLEEAELGALLQISAAQLGPAGAEVDAHPGGARARLTWALPDNPLGRYLNLSFDLAQTSRGIAIDRMRLGSLDVPAPLASWLLEQGDWLLRRNETYARLMAAVNGFRFSENSLKVLYQPASSVSRFADLVPAAERERLLAHAERIATVSRDPYMGRSVSVVLFLEPLFANARDRTATRGQPGLENQAALTAMMFYLVGIDVPRLLGVEPRPKYATRPHGLTLLGREDLARHFILAAGARAAADDPLLAAVGLFDNVAPVAGADGLSLARLAADRAGTRLAEAATGPEAERVQAVMSASLWETDFMPEVKDLYASVASAEASQGTRAAGYEDALRDIDGRIAQLKVHQ